MHTDISKASFYFYFFFKIRKSKLKIVVKATGAKEVDWIHLAQDNANIHQITQLKLNAS
jgi:hypothetical protein